MSEAKDPVFEHDLQNMLYQFLRSTTRSDKFRTQTFIIGEEWVNYQENPSSDQIVKIISLKHYEMNIAYRSSQFHPYCSFSNSKKPKSYYMVLHVLESVNSCINVSSFHHIVMLQDFRPNCVNISINMLYKFIEHKCKAKIIIICAEPYHKRNMPIDCYFSRSVKSDITESLDCDRIDFELFNSNHTLTLFPEEEKLIRMLKNEISLVFYSSYNYINTTIPIDMLNTVSPLNNVSNLRYFDEDYNGTFDFTHKLTARRDEMNVRRLMINFCKSDQYNHPLANKNIMNIVRRFLY